MKNLTSACDLCPNPQEKQHACLRNSFERAAAWVCREAKACRGSGTSTSPTPAPHPDRRVTHRGRANGLSPWNGAELAIDMTLVSAVDAAPSPHAPASALPKSMPLAVGSLSSLIIEVGGRWRPVRLLARCRARAVPAACWVGGGGAGGGTLHFALCPFESRRLRSFQDKGQRWVLRAN